MDYQFAFDSLPAELRICVLDELDLPTSVSFRMISLECRALVAPAPKSHGAYFSDACIKLGYRHLLKWAVQKGCPVDLGSFELARDCPSASMLKYLLELAGKFKQPAVLDRISFGMGRLKKIESLADLAHVYEKLSRREESRTPALYLLEEFIAGAVKAGDIEFLYKIERALLCENQNPFGEPIDARTFFQCVLVASNKAENSKIFSHFFEVFEAALPKRTATLSGIPLLSLPIFQWLCKNDKMEQRNPLLNFYLCIQNYSAKGDFKSIRFLLENSQAFVNFDIVKYGLIFRALIHAVKHCHADLVEYFTDLLVREKTASVLAYTPDFEIMVNFSTKFSHKDEAGKEKQYRSFLLVAERLGFLSLFTNPLDEAQASYKSTYFEAFKKCILETQNTKLVGWALSHGIDLFTSDALKHFLDDLLTHPGTEKFSTEATPDFLADLEARGVDYLEVFRQFKGGEVISLAYITSRALHYGNVACLDFAIGKAGGPLHVDPIDETSFASFLRCFASYYERERYKQYHLAELFGSLISLGKLVITPTLEAEIKKKSPCYFTNCLLRSKKENL